MTKKLFLLTSLLPLLVKAQTADFTLSGRIGHFNAPATIYFDHMEGEISKADSAVLIDGNFSFSGKVNGPSGVRIIFAPRGGGKENAMHDGDVIYPYIGAENIRMESRDSLANATFKGSAVYDDYVAYNKAIGGSIMDLDKVANAEFNSGTEAQKKDTAWFNIVNGHFQKSVLNRAGKELDFAKTHPHSYFSLVALTEQTRDGLSAGRIQPVFATLDDQLRNSLGGKRLEEKLKALTAIVPGSLAPDFTQPDSKGQPLTLSHLRGKYVLVDFWASWCGPCRAENPNVKKQYELYRDKGFEVISVSLDDNKKKWQDAIAQDGLPWTQVSDLKGWNNEAGKLYGISGVPACFLIDPQGKIVATGLRGEELNKKLAELFLN